MEVPCQKIVIPNPTARHAAFPNHRFFSITNTHVQLLHIVFIWFSVAGIVSVPLVLSCNPVSIATCLGKQTRRKS